VTRRQRWSVAQIRALGVTTDLVTAGSVLGIGRTTAYRLARSGAFPVPVLKVGNRNLVAVAHLLKAVGVED
jgi:NAD(P)-dependent dehydrogenase (short-subunit alcohol dehydrogenase family)